MKLDLVDLDMSLHHETKPQLCNDGALLVSLDGNRAKAVWLPKSLVSFEVDQGRGTVAVTIPEWLAIQKGLV